MPTAVFSQMVPRFSSDYLSNRASFIGYMISVKVSFQVRPCTYVTMGVAACSEAIKIGGFHEEQNLGQQGVRSNCFPVTLEVLGVKRGQQGNLEEDNFFCIRNLHVS